MILSARVLILSILAALPMPLMAEAAYPEARPFVETDNAAAKIDNALASAAKNDKRVIVILGANWCHDSRALAGWFATPRFAAMLNERYEIVFVDVGMPQTQNGRNLDIAHRFGFNKMKSTPLVIVLAPDGRMLNNRKSAIGWRNAASRSENSIFDYFNNFAVGQK